MEFLCSNFLRVPFELDPRTVVTFVSLETYFLNKTKVGCEILPILVNDDPNMAADFRKILVCLQSNPQH